MHTVIRTYAGTGAKELMDRLEIHRDEVENIIRSVPGFVSYTLLRTADGCASVTTCQDQAGTDASMERARAWILHNAADLNVNPPTVFEGDCLIHAT